MEPKNMDLEDPRDQSAEKAAEDGDSGRLGSESDISNLKQPGPPRMSRLHDIAFILTICTAQIMALAGVGQALAPLYIVGDSFGVTNDGELSWYLAAYSLTVGTFILPAGRLGDMYGHKRIFLIGSIWFAVWSLIAGFSVYSGTILFSVCRGFQGIGPALMVPNAVAIAGRSFEGQKKNIVFSLFGACAPAGAVVGAVFGAIFSEFVWWPWTYWVQGILLFAYAASSFLILPFDEHNPAEGGSKPTFDFAGTITGVSGLILFNFAWNQAGVVGWTIPYTYILLIVGVLFFGAFLYIERNVAKHPLVPIRGLSKEAMYALSMIACGWASFGIWVYYLYQMFLQLRHHSPLSAAAQQVPVIISGLCASLAVGFLLARTKAAYIMVAAMACFLVGQIILATTPINQTYWAQTFVTSVIMPWGMDMSFPCGTIILSNGMPREHQGIAASLVNTVVNYSISISLGIAGTIIRQTNDGGMDVLGSYRNAWYFAIGLDGLGLAIALYFMWISVFRGKAVS